MTLSRSWPRQGAVLAAALLLAGAATLSGCATYALIDSLPAAVGGLPEGAPERPATPQPYPAVHDMPPARSDTPLTEAERKRMKEELIAIRNRAARQAASPEATGSTSSSGSAPSAPNP